MKVDERKVKKSAHKYAYGASVALGRSFFPVCFHSVHHSSCEVLFNGVVWLLSVLHNELVSVLCDDVALSVIFIGVVTLNVLWAFFSSRLPAKKFQFISVVGWPLLMVLLSPELRIFVC